MKFDLRKFQEGLIAAIYSRARARLARISEAAAGEVDRDTFIDLVAMFKKNEIPWEDKT